MYTLLGIDTVIRIALAMTLLFIVVPALAWRKPAAFSRLEWFWWNLGVGIVVLTLAGQLFTLFNIAGSLTYIALLASIVIFCRARRARVGPLQWIAYSYRAIVLFALNVLDGRITIRRHVARFRRERYARLATALRANASAIAIWSTIVLVAAAFRLYRPFTTANLGFSDTYVHLYLMRLLDAGRQVDPAWGPYPRGMHFLLLAIKRLTNADDILLLNFFGAFAGVLMTLSAAYAAKRITRSNIAALVAGLLFATMTGGAHQYFLLGGSALDRASLQLPYAQLESSGEFDVLLTAFERQTSTLPQELAIALLFPAVIFFIDAVSFRAQRETSDDAGDSSHVCHSEPAERRKARSAVRNPPLKQQDAPDAGDSSPSARLGMTRLAGFIGCGAAIAAIHSGVVLPLVLVCVLATIPIAIKRPRALIDAAMLGASAIALGSTWMLGFLFYRPSTHVDSTALYYFPFLRPQGEAHASMMLTPFLIAMLAVALFVAWRHRAEAMWLALAVIVFIVIHASSALGIPEVVEATRNASWLALSIAVLIGVAAVSIRALPAIVLAAWLITIPNLNGAFMRGKLLDYSGYGATTYAVLRMSSQLEPFTWTLVSYGQEYPMVIGRGFHLAGADFLERFDPADAPLRIPTPFIFIAVEKKPHRFQINNWAARFDRSTIEERLQTWCSVYRMTHHDMRVWLDDENVRVYAIERRPAVAALGGGGS
jgi:hypothetical protein